MNFLRKDLVSHCDSLQVPFMDRKEALEKLRVSKFYGIVDAGYVQPEGMEQAAIDLCEGGADLVQLRAKGIDLSLVKEWAKTVQSVCKDAGVVFILNDYPEMAAELGCDGVHIGQDDGSLAEARALVGADMVVGRSTHSKEQAVFARDEGFDYIGFGPLFPTPTKKGRPGIGMENIPFVEENVGADTPVYCIGGVREDNLAEVISAGARRVVIVSDVLSANQRVEKVKRIVSTLDK